jgi:hypothetical protein
MPALLGISVRKLEATLIVGICLLAQFAFQENIIKGGTCMESLAGLSEEVHPYYQQVSFGLPMRLLSIEYKGCFEERISTVEWLFVGLVVNLLSVAIFGCSPIWLLSLVKKFKTPVKPLIG